MGLEAIRGQLTSRTFINLFRLGYGYWMDTGQTEGAVRCDEDGDLMGAARRNTDTVTERKRCCQWVMVCSTLLGQAVGHRLASLSNI